MAVGSTYRVLRQAAYAEVQRLWGEWRGREGRPRRPALRRPGRKATVEALEPRQMLSVGASISGSSHFTESSSAFVLNLTGTNTTGTRNGWVISWGDGTANTTASSAATSATHVYTDGHDTITATFSDTEGVVMSSTSTMAVTVDEAAGNASLAYSACGSVAEGSAYTIFPTFSEPGGEKASYAVWWGDSTSSTVYPTGCTAFNHCYFEQGSYNFTVAAYDSDHSAGPASSAASSATGTANISEAVPNLSVWGPSSVTEGSAYSLTANFFDPGADTVCTYVAWWGDNSSDTVTSGGLATLTHPYMEPGNYCVTLVAFDEDHSTGLSTWAAPSGYSANVVVNVCEATPTLLASGGGVASITEGSTYTLHPLFTDPGQDPLTIVRVDWGDGSASTYPGTLSNIVHNYAAEPSHYTVTFQAYDEDEPYPGNYGTSAYTASVALTVNEAAQTDWISLPSSIFPHNTYNYTVGVSDPGGDLATYTIDWGDGSTSSNTVAGTSAVFAHSYASNSNYNVTVTAVDEDGAYNGHFVAVVSDVPTASAYGDNGGGSVVEGSSYNLQATFNDLAGHVASSWVINWGDNHVDTENTSAGPFNHIYTEASNSYLIQASAYDVDGVTTINVNANIIEGTAVAAVWGASTAYESSTPNYTLNFGFTDPEDSASSWWVDWGDGTPSVVYGGAPSTAAHGYAEPGTYHPKFVALDEDHPTLAPNGSDGSYSAVTTVTISEASGAQAGLAGTSTVTEGSQYDLTIGFTDPGGDTPTDYKVNWGDAGGVQDYPNATTNVFTHIYNDASSNYVITASAITEDDNTGDYSSTHSLAVCGVAPLMWINGSTTTQQGADYSVSLAALYPPNDPDGETPGALNWTVDWGDGQDPAHPDTTTVTGSSVNSPVHHTYMQAGQFVVTATASDDDTTWSPVLLNGQLDVGFGLSHDGILTTDFNNSVQHDEGRGVALQPDGSGGFKIVAEGVSYGADGLPQVVLARYNPDGTPDLEFGDPVSGIAEQPRTGEVFTVIGNASAGSAMIVQPDGSILVGGTSGTGSFTLARYIPDGTRLDPTFGPNHTGIVTSQLDGSAFGAVSLAIQSLPGGDRVIVAQSVGGSFTLSRFDMSGNYDTAFGTVMTHVGSGGVSGALAIDDNFNILIAGQINGQFTVARYLPGGGVDLSFNHTGRATTPLSNGSMVAGVSIAVESDGKIVLAGTDYASDALDFALVRYKPDGTLDTSSFGTNGTGGITITAFPQGVGAYALTLALAGDADGNTERIVVAGTAGGVVALAGYTTSGQLDRTFGIGGTLQTPLGAGASRAAALLVQPDGKILLAGTANNDVAVVNLTDVELARYEKDNTLTVTSLAGELSASASEFGEIDLAWTDNTPPGTQVDIQRAVPGVSDFASIATVDASLGAYVDLSVTGGTRYQYRLSVTGPWYSNVVDLTARADSDPVTIDGPGAGVAGGAVLFKLNAQGVPRISRWTMNFGDGTPPKEFDTNTVITEASHTFAGAGDFVVTATASDGPTSFTSNHLPIVVKATPSPDSAANIAINFEPGYKDIPNGYLLDVGHVYSSRGDYFSYNANYIYGWDADMTANAVKRGSSLSPDQRHDTFISMQPGGVNHSWSIALPDGTYQVHIVAGDPAATNSNYQILANGVSVINGIPSASQRWFDNTAQVLVSDGRLTISNAAGAVNNKIDYIEITPAQAAALPPAAPGNLTAVAASSTAVDLHWTDNSNADMGFKVERSANGGHWVQIGVADPNAQSYYDTNCTPSTSYSYRIRATDAYGDSAPTDVAIVTTPATSAEAPYGGTVPRITDRIEAENFDTGGEGVSYHDDNTDNIGGQYRNTGVDIGPNDYLSSPGYMVGWTHTGEWMNYTVNIAQAGNYRLDFRLASSGPGGQFSVRVDGATVANSISLPDTGGWGSYVTLSQENVPLPSGTHVLQLYMQRVGADFGVGNCDWFQAVPMPTTPAAPESLTAAPAGGQSVNLAWQAPPSPSAPTGYLVQRSDDQGFSFSTITTTPLAAGTLTYNDTAAPAGMNCIYRVEAINAQGSSQPSNLAAVVVPAAGTLAVAASADASAWQAHPDVNYGSPGQLLARGGATNVASHIYLTFDTSGFTDTVDKVELRLFGRLDGSNQTGVTVDAQGVNGTWGENTLTWNNYPAAGATLSTTTVSEEMGRWYTWDVTSYVVAQRQAGQSIVSLMLQPTVATNGNLVFPSRESATNAPVLLISPPSRPAAPTLAATADNAASVVHLSWQETSTSVSGFHLLRGTSSNDLQPLTDLGPNALTYDDSSNLSQGQAYYYQVIAYNNVGSGPSNIASASFTDGLQFTSYPGGSYQLLQNPSTPFGQVSPTSIKASLDNGETQSYHLEATTPSRPQTPAGYVPPAGQPGKLSIVPDASAGDLVKALVAKGGTGLQITNANVQYQALQIGDETALSTGIFVNDSPTYSLPNYGIVLSTGNVADYGSGPNQWDSNTTPYGTVATPAENVLLRQISGTRDHLDTTEIDLTFNVLPGFDTVYFTVAFGSEEYPSYIYDGSPYVDAFGLFLNGTNIAMTNDGYPVNIKNPAVINYPGTELNGMLAPGGNPLMTFSAAAIPGSTNNTLTFIIADSHDDLYDTTAYIASLGATPPDLATVSVTAPGNDSVVPVVNDAQNVSREGVAAFDGKLNGDGSDHAFNLLAWDKNTGELVGSVPVTINKPYEYRITATDPDGEVPTFSLLPVDNQPGSLAPDAQIVDGNLLRWQPSQAGHYHFKLQADDGNGHTALQEFWVDVTTTQATDNAPHIDSVAPTAATVGTALSYQVHATDTNPGDTPSYYLSNAPRGMQIDHNTGLLTWTPADDQGGTETATVVALDGLGGRGTQALSLTVGGGTFQQNQPPTVTSTDITTAVVGREYQYQVAAFDPNGDQFFFDPIQLPPGMTLDPVGGLLDWVPQQPGSYTVSFQVRDLQGAALPPHTFTITAYTPPAPPAGLVATTISRSEIDLSWTKSQGPIAGYDVYRSTTDGFTPSPQNRIASGVQDPIFVDKGLAIETEYHYRVTAADANQIRSDPTAQADAFTLGAEEQFPVIQSVSIVQTAADGGQLSVAADPPPGDLESSLIYTWAVVTAPAGVLPPDFGADNGSNQGKSLAVTFHGPGTYLFRVTATDPNNVTSDKASLPVRFQSMLTTIELSPPAITLAFGGQKTITATFLDQFGLPLPAPADAQWTLSGGGQLSSQTATSAVYTAPAQGSGASIFLSTAAVSSAPTIVTLSASGNLPPYFLGPPAITGRTTSTATLSARADDDGGAQNLTYTWSLTDPLGAGDPTFASSNGTYAARDILVTFHTPGTWHFRVTVADQPGATASLDLTTALTIGRFLDQPLHFTAVAVSSQQVELRWDAVSGATYYTVMRTNPDGTAVAWDTTANPDYDQSLPTDTTYAYSVTAKDDGGDTSDPSASASASTWALPLTPANLTAQAVSGTQIKLSWTDPRVGPNPDVQVMGWQVFRATSSDGNPPPDSAYEPLQRGNEVYIYPYFYDQDLNPSTHYWYKVIAQKHIEEQSPAALGDAVTLRFAGVPLAPTNLAAAYAGAGRAGLRWDGVPGDNLLGYDIYRSTDPNFVPSASTLVGSSQPQDSQFTDDNLVEGIYYYRVVAVNDSGEGTGREIDSPASLAASVDTHNSTANPAPPAAPGSFLATDVGSDHVTLAWTDQSLNEAGFEIRRRDSGGTVWAVAGYATQDATAFTDTAVLGSSSYDYEIAAYSIQTTTVGQSPQYSAWVPLLGIYTPDFGPKPSQPGALMLQHEDATKVDFTWTAPVDGPDVLGYAVYRTTDPAKGWTRLTSSPQSDTEFVDHSVDPSTTYYYQVRAVTFANRPSDPTDALVVTTDTSDALPTIKINSPSSFQGSNGTLSGNDGRIQTLTPVMVTIDAPAADPANWSLSLHPLDAGSAATDTLLADGTGSVGTGHNPDGSPLSPAGVQIFALDPTLYPSGNYQLILKAGNSLGNAPDAVVVVSLYSETKLGNLTLPVTDLQVNVPGGVPITVSRVYDSQQADLPGDFGFGWRLDASNSTVRTTAMPAPDAPAGSVPAFRAGDLVYITLPGGEQHVFQFFPVPMSYTPGLSANPYGNNSPYLSDSFLIQFVCVDGTNSTLTVPGDLHESAQYQTLLTDQDPVFISSATNDPYNPVNFGNQYVLQTADHHTYTLTASTGQLISSEDPNGNTITYGTDGSIQENGYQLQINRNPDNTISSIRVLGPSGTVVGNTATYSYETDSAGNPLLRSVTDQTQATTTYVNGDDLLLRRDGQVGDTLYAVIKRSGDGAVWNQTTSAFETWADANLSHYVVALSAVTDAGGVPRWYVGAVSGTVPAGTALQVSYRLRAGASPAVSDAVVQSVSQTWNNPPAHYLTNVIDPRGVESLSAAYDALGRLTGLTDSQGRAASLTAGGSEGGRGSQIATDLTPQHDTTETIYDDHGDAVRQIQRLTDADGNVSYLVTVHEFDFHSGDLSGEINNILQTADSNTGVIAPGVSGQNSLTSQKDFAPFVITGTDAAGLRYSQIPTTLLHETDFDTGTDQANAADPNLRLPIRDVSYAGQDAAGNDVYRVTSFGSYTLGKSGSVVQTLETHDAAGNVISATRVTETSSTYDANGNFTQSTDPAGDVTSYSYTTGGDYTYADGTEKNYADIPKGLPLESWRGATRTTGMILSKNVYYTAADVAMGVSGALAGSLESSTDAAGLTTRTTYYPDGNVEAVYHEWTDAAGNQHSVTLSQTVYDGAGRPTQVTDANGQPTKTWYDSSGQVSVTQDQYGGLTINTYDTGGNLIRTLNPDGTETRTVYDAMGRVIWQTDPFASTSMYSFNSTTGVATFTSNDSTTTEIVTHTLYDSLGREIGTERYKDASIVLSADPSVDGILLMTGAPDAVALTTAGDRLSTTSTIYDDQGRVAESTDAAGLRTGSVYFPDGRVQYTGILDPAAPADWFTGSDPTAHFLVDPVSGRRQYATYAYDQVQQQGGITVIYDSVTDALGHTTKTYKDAMGRPTKVLYDDGSSTQTVYGAFGQQVTRIDAMGQATDSYYDLAGRLVKVVLPPPDPTQPGLRPTWAYTYDAMGDQLSITDPRSLIANQTWNPKRSAVVTTFTYDDQGRELSRTLPDGETEHWTYDGFGRMLTHSDFKGQGTRYAYFDSGPHAGQMDAEYRYAVGVDPLTGQAAEKTSYGYDSLNRQNVIAEWTWNSGAWQRTQTQVTLYDPISGGESDVLTYGAGTDPSAPGATPVTAIHYVYDPATGRHTETSTANTDTHYDYDTQGRLWHVTVTKLNGQALTTSLVTTYAYDLAGNLQSILLPNGVITTYGYDDLNRLKTETTTRPGSIAGTTDTLASYTYTLRADGLRTGVTEHVMNPAGSTSPFSDTKIAWTYDGDDRLLTETYDAHADDPALGHGNDSQDYKDTYAYDPAGNRLSKTHDAGDDGSLTNDASDVIGTYRYGTVNAGGTFTVLNGDDQLTYESDVTGGTNPVTTVTRSGYDANGSLTSKTVTVNGTTTESDTYAYDLRNRLASATVAGQNIAYGYDVNGTRVSETVGSQTTDSLIDANNPSGYSQTLEQSATPGGTPTTTNVIGMAGILAQVSGTGSVTYLLTDGHGSTRQVISSAGVVNSFIAYDAFGNALTSPAGTNYLYSGQRLDAGTGVYDLRARFYEPEVGRFSTSDNITITPGDLGNANLYLYVADNPLNMLDPSGHVGVGELSAVAGIDNLFNGLEFTAFNAVSTTVRGVERGQSANQVLASFMIDQAIQVGAMVGLSFLGSIVGSLREGSLFSSLAEEGEVGILGPASKAGAIEEEAAQEEQIFFGQRKASDRFSTKPEVPAALRGRPLSDVVQELKSGTLSPDAIRIEVFRDPVSGKLVSANTRGLATLSEAGLKPTNVVEVQYTRALRKRLLEPTFIPDAPLPGPYVPIGYTNKLEDTLCVYRVVSLPGAPAY
jgi:RHS repeat-associated protein/uncharacterized delta-60 repeat protein